MRSESRSRSNSPSDFRNERGGDRGNRGGQRSQKILNDTPPSNKVYVTFLPEDIQEDQLKELFEECGQISRIYLKKKDDGFTFAHISYQDVGGATNAIEKLNRRKMGGKSMKVQYSREMRSESREGGDRGGRGDKNGKGDFGGRGESDTRKKFDGGNEGLYEDRDRGRPRGGGFGNGGDDRVGRVREGGNRQSGFGRGNDRGPMKSFKYQEEGQTPRNYPNEGGNDRRSRDQGQGQRGGGDYKHRPKFEKMSEDECGY